MGARARDKLSIRLDWVNISYRNLYLAGAAAVLLAVGGLVAFQFRDSLSDLFSKARKEAHSEITAAEKLLSDASQYGRDPRAAPIRENAEQKLSEARRNYASHDYQDSCTAAIVAQNYAQKIIDMGRGESATQREVRVYKFEGEVRVKRAGQFHWEDATANMMLRIGDQIKTGSKSVAQIIYFDGSQTTVRQESLLEIKDLYEEPSTRQRRVREKLNWGEVESTTRKANVAGSFHEIQSENATAKSDDDADFKVAYDKNTDEGRISLFNGNVDVSTEHAGLKMKEGETVAIDKGGLGAVEKLPPTPRLLAPTDQNIFVYTSPKDMSTTLAWEKMPQAALYHLQLSERALFSDPILDKADIKVSTVELPGLPPAAYYWRVAAVDDQGRPGPWSPARKFRITTTEVRDRSDKTPPALSITEFTQNGPFLIVNGKTEPGATLWVDDEKIDVDETGVFFQVVRLKKEGANQVRIVAQDRAGNESRKTLEAYVESF